MPTWRRKHGPVPGYSPLVDHRYAFGIAHSINCRLTGDASTIDLGALPRNC